MNLISGYYEGSDPFGIFKDILHALAPSDIKKNSVLILWGGEDISPSLYKQPVVHAHASNLPSKRDIVESTLFKTAVDKNIPIIGICRGAQLACALSGGTLFQHINGGHHGNHIVETMDGHTYTTSSCHHQALNLANTKHELLAWDKDRKTRVYTDKDSFETTIPEVVYFPETKAFAIQGHPEWMHHKAPFVAWCAQQIKERFF